MSECDGEDDDRTPDQEAWDRRYEARKVEAAWRAEGSYCDADPGMGVHIGNPCMGCGRQVFL